ncbi:MAG TPA: pyridoxal-phosphate dependent enzyme [Kiloniellaceae bacterium]|nr:pyridoxal-phosphate dependent enzyme [Kiloniellaceae bacterium]
MTATNAGPAPVYGNVLEAIGNTPMIEVRHLERGPCRLFLKLESQNPGGSIKDRVGKSMIEAAERDGRLKPGGRIIEATAGNTGLGLALVAAQKGYKLSLVVPDKMAQEKIFHLKALGTEVILTRSDVGKGHPEYYQDMAQRIADETGAFYANQFENPANPLAHETTTGPEIWAQMDGQLDAMVCGVGSGGTIAGLSRYFEKVSPATEMILADPEGSILTHYVESGEVSSDVGSWVVEGIGEDFVPANADNLRRVAKAYSISDREALLTARELLEKEGILAGSSSGTLLAAALRYCRAQSTPKRVVTLVCDSGNKYLSKMFNDYWMLEQGFIERERHGDLRDLIPRPHAQHSTVVVGPDDDLLIAYGRMKLYDISQLPVLDGNGRVIGLIDESDILHRVVADERCFADKVASAMTTRLQTVPVTAALEDLLAVFERDLVAIVMDGENFLGLITRIDLLNHLRRKLK